MEKQFIIEKYKKQEDKILVSRLFDKIEICKKTNKVVNLDFLDPAERKILENVINIIKIKNYIFFGGVGDCQRSVLIIYPEKLDDIFKNETFDFNTIIHPIRILLPQELQGTSEHRTYLGGLIKLGIKREKIGDIVTYKEGADVIVSSDISKFILANLAQLTRFSKCDIEKIQLSEIHENVQEYKNLKVIVSSMRLDNIVAELVGTSRNKASEFICQERVFINYENETKLTKLVKENDIISIRGKGKFIIGSIDGETRSGRVVLQVLQYV